MEIEKLVTKSEREEELQRLYAERDKAFQEIQRIKEMLGNAENKWLSIKREIAERHKAAGARG